MTRTQTRLANRAQNRRGAALVECAIVMPVMIMAVLGMFELGRAVMVTEVMAHAARTGARTAVLPSGSTTNAKAAVNDLLQDSGINPTNCTVNVLVNGNATEVASAKAGDEITVTVSVPYAKVTWVANPDFMTGKSLSGRCAMRRE